MTTFIQPNFPTSHAGLARIESAAQMVAAAMRKFDATRSTASLLLAAMISAAVVVINQVIDTWADGHLMAAWLLLWVVVFSATAMFAAPLRRAVQRVRSAGRAWAERRAQAAADEQYWQTALDDARIMADISRAMSVRAERYVRAYTSGVGD